MAIKIRYGSHPPRVVVVDFTDLLGQQFELGHNSAIRADLRYCSDGKPDMIALAAAETFSVRQLALLKSLQGHKVELFNWVQPAESSYPPPDEVLKNPDWVHSGSAEQM